MKTRVSNSRWIGRLGGLAVLAALAPSLASAQVGPPASTPVPAQFQESYKVFLDMKAKARPAKLPDWSGLWTRANSPAGLAFDPKQPSRVSEGRITAELTPEYEAKFHKKLAEVAAGIEWDQLSYCLPSGFPRWLTEPFLREAIVTPKETWWIQEQESEVRRIYTDGRGHVPDEEAFPLWDGDSIGFWDGDTLVVHTIRVKPGEYNRSQPDYSDQTSTVERIRMTDPNTMEDQVTVWDPLSLKKPWSVVEHWNRVTTPGSRIDMWSCEENNNVVKTSAGSTDFVLPGEAGYKDPGKILDPEQKLQQPRPR